MTRALHELERVESRVLGALRCVDAATRVTVAAPLQVSLADAHIRRNRSGLHVIMHARSLEAHSGAFLAAPAVPAPASLAFSATVRDASGHYLPRLAAFTLPRDPLPENAAQPASLFRPIEVELYPASVAPVGVNWAVLRATVRADGSGHALGGALLRVLSGGTVIARGLSDWRGEALVGVPGVPVTTWASGPGAVVVSEIAVEVEVVFDPAAGSALVIAEVRAGRPPTSLPLVDPDRLEAQRAALPNAVLPALLASGRSQSLAFSIALP